MNKYFSIYNTSFKHEKTAIVDTLLRCVIYFVIMYIMIQLWSYIYGGGVNKIINGYSLNQMIWYLLIGEMVINCVRTRSITQGISNEVRSGSICYKLNKPYNYYMYCVTTSMAKSCFTFLFLFPVSVVVGLIFVGIPDGFVWFQIFPYLLTILLSFLLMWAVFGIVGLLAFWVQDSTPFSWIVQKLFFLFGMLFPVEFFPSWLQPIIRYSPIYSIMSGPSSLVSHFSWVNFCWIVVSQIIWIIITLTIGLLIYKLGKRKVSAYGG